VFRYPLLLLSLLLSLPALAWQGDPTRPLLAGPAAAVAQNKGDMVLQSIIRKQQAYKAVINGRLVGLGESINGYQVMEIKSSSVLLKSAKERLELSLFSGGLFTGEVKQQK